MRKNVTLVLSFAVAYLITRAGLELDADVDEAVAGIVAGVVAYLVPEG